MSFNDWMRRQVNDTSQGIILFMVVLMMGWSLVLFIPDRTMNHECRNLIDPIGHHLVFGIVTFTLAIMGVISVAITNLTLRALALVSMSIMTGLIACAYWHSAHYTMNAVVYSIFTFQSWWALATLPTKDGAR